jgi:hypothetical protein
MDTYFLVGAIFGSGLFIFAGREPAKKLVSLIKDSFGR